MIHKKTTSRHHKQQVSYIQSTCIYMYMYTIQSIPHCDKTNQYNQNGFPIRNQSTTNYSIFQLSLNSFTTKQTVQKSTRKWHTGGGTSSRVAKMTFRIRGVSIGGSHGWIQYNNLENTPILGVIMRGSPLWRGRWTQWTRVAWPNGKRASRGGRSESSLSE